MRQKKIKCQKDELKMKLESMKSDSSDQFDKQNLISIKN